MTLCVVDTSVIFKWTRHIAEEEYVAQSIAILENHLNGNIKIHVPDLLVYEIGNILSCKENIKLETAVSIIESVLKLQLKIHNIDFMLAQITINFAKELKITFYDAVFVALSSILNCTFITVDKKLYAKIKSIQGSTYLGDITV